MSSNWTKISLLTFQVWSIDVRKKNNFILIKFILVSFQLNFQMIFYFTKVIIVNCLKNFRTTFVCINIFFLLFYTLHFIIFTYFLMYSIECLLAIFNRSTSLKICFEIDTVESFEFVGANFRGLGGGCTYSWECNFSDASVFSFSKKANSFLRISIASSRIFPASSENPEKLRL